MKDNKIPSNERSHTVCKSPKFTAIAKAPRVLPVLSAILMLVNVGALAQVEVPFFLEDFEDGNATDGNPVKWAPTSEFPAGSTGRVVDGSYVLTTTEPSSVWADQPASIGDVSIRAVVRGVSLTSVDNVIVLFARAQPEELGGGSYWGSVAPLGLHIAMTAADGSRTVMGTHIDSDFSLKPFRNDINVQFDVVGRKVSLTAWVVGSPKPSPQLTGEAPSALPPGRVGFYTDAPEIAIRSFDAIRIGDSVLPAPTVGIQLNPGIVIHGTEGMHHRVEWRDALTPDSPWQLLEDIPSLPAATHVVYDPTPVSATNHRFYQAVMVP